jgi:hypothetical protein
VKLVLLHSPLVGPGTWEALAPLLRAHGHAVVTPDLAVVMQQAPPFYSRLAIAAAGLADGAVLVAHSGAGALVPEIARRANIRGVVFVDALLPHPGKSWFETTSAGLQTHLRGLARDGRLPPWHLWWPKGVIETMLPDAVMFARVTLELRSLPSAYFEEPAPNVKLETPSAYLQLSGSYKSEADQVEVEGWSVERLALHHLAILTHPDKVAAEIERLAADF